MNRSRETKEREKQKADGRIETKEGIRKQREEEKPSKKTECRGRERNWGR